MGDSQIGVVAVPLLIVGIVQAVKNLLGWQGNKVCALAMGLGAFFVGLATCLEQGLFTPEAAVLIETAVYALAGGLAALGYYDLGKRFRPYRFSEAVVGEAIVGVNESVGLPVAAPLAIEPVTSGDYVIPDGHGWFLVRVMAGGHLQMTSDRAQAAHMSIAEAMDIHGQLQELTRGFPAGSHFWQILADSDEVVVPERFAPVCERAANE
jgi:hypothetical protein